MVAIDDKGQIAEVIELSDRQKRIAIMLSLGNERKEIAEELGLSAKTIDSHRQHILHILRLKNTVELARYALRVGWVTL